MAPLSWSTEPFVQLNELFSSYDVSDEQLEKSISEILDDLRNLLEVPVKNDSSRKSLTPDSTVELEGVQYRINSDFVAQACVLSDELNIDEKIAATYLSYGQMSSEELDRPPAQAAVILFHMRRGYILDIVRVILEYALQPDLDNYSMYRDLAKKLATPEFVSRVVKSMGDLRGTLRALQEKETSGHFLGRDLDEEFVENIKIRRDATLKEHELLSQVLVMLCRLDYVNADQLKSLLEITATLERYDQVLVHYAVAVIAFFEAICVPVDEFDRNKSKTLLQNAMKIQTYIAERAQKPSAKVPYFHAAVELWWYVYFNRMCASERDSEQSLISKIDYVKDLYKPALSCIINGGAFEFMMIMASDFSSESEAATSHTEMKTILQSKTLQSAVNMQGQVTGVEIPLVLEVAFQTSDTFEKVFTESMGCLVDAIISDMPDLLKELCFKEEELLFGDDGASEQPDGNQPDDLGPLDMELEKFFMFISYLYAGRPDSSVAFWSDNEGNLYGFLVWASQCQTPLMIASYCDMLASLSAGDEISLAAYNFLKGSDDSSFRGGVARAQQPRSMSWSYLFEAFSYYITQLQDVTPEQNMFASNAPSRSLIAIADLPELNDDDSLIMASYLRLLEQIAKWSPSIARASLIQPTPTLNVYNLLFSLLKCRTSLTGAIFNVIAAFAAEAPRSERAQIWTALDSWLLHEPIVVSRTPHALSGAPGRSQHLTFQDRFNILLTSYPDILGFVSLIDCLTRVPIDGSINDIPFPDNLGEQYRSPPGIRPYIDFIMEEVFYPSMAAELPQKQKLTMQIPCLRFIRNCIQDFNTDLVALTSASSGADAGSGGVNVEMSIQPRGLANYIRTHACVWIMDKLFQEKIYSVLFSISALGIDTISEPSVIRDDANEAVALALQVILRILTIEDVYLDVLEPAVRAAEAGGDGTKPSLVSASSRALLGIRNFEDAILFNIFVVTNFALYVNSESINVASLAIKVLDIIARAPQFLNLDYDAPVQGTYANGVVPGITSKTSFNYQESGNRIGVNRLLSALDSVSESRRIMFGFISQLQRPSESYGEEDDPTDELKLEILDFLSRNLNKASSSALRSPLSSADMALLDIDVSTLSDVPTISHFLLGFKIGDGATAASTAVLQRNHEHGGVDSQVSLFKTVVSIMSEHIQNVIDGRAVSPRDAAFCRISMEILYKLCTAKISSPVALELLRSSDYDFFKSRISVEPLVTMNTTRWGAATFRELLTPPNNGEYEELEDPSLMDRYVPTEVDEEKATTTLLHFFASRTCLFEYASVELHSVSEPITSVFEGYVKLLTIANGVDKDSSSSALDFGVPIACETAKALELLDFLEFDIEQLAGRWGVNGSPIKISDILPLVQDVPAAAAEGSGDALAVQASDYSFVFGGLRLDDACMYALPPTRSTMTGGGSGDFFGPSEVVYDMTRVEGILELKVREQQNLGRLPYPTPEIVERQRRRIIIACRRFNAIISLRRAQSQCLAAWCRLLRIILIDTTPLISEPDRIPGRDSFMLETMQVLAPKMLHYAHVWESRVAEHLASACASLIAGISQYAALEESSANGREDDEDDVATDIAHTVFRGSLIAVQSPYASASVRADLYTLINIFICSQPTWKVGKLSQLQRTIESCANGAPTMSSSGEGQNADDVKENRLIERIANDAVSGEGITRIMSLTVLRAFAAVENVTGRYFLLNALVRYNLLLLLVRSIRRIDEELDDENRVSNYEVTAFKAVMVFLTELAQSRTGAAQIIQSGLFPLIQGMKYLTIDPDVGIFTFASHAPVNPVGSRTLSSFWPVSESGGSAGGGGRNVFFELVAPTLRLLACCLLSMGQRNYVVLKYVRDTLSRRMLLTRAILRRIVGLDVSQSGQGEASGVTTTDDEIALLESGKLIILMSNLTSSVAEEEAGIA
ncbi:nucleoporin Nup186/Nup192/Nup205 [Myxozyma melibiosi]|uniref:Nucleoporin Nup186/Nup192/Nup205 n=1 Tax=Myxozyma melibiosi TaxID=54550 RepID=A0ABR1EZ06_9ASCO